jgi:hypothetical protein
MTMKKLFRRLGFTVVVLALFAFPGHELLIHVIDSVAAQVPSLLLPSPTGLEQIEVLIPSTGTVVTSPQKVQVTLNQIRNSTGYALVAGGTTVATQITNAQDNVLATGAITTWNVNLPTAPADGQQVNIGCPGGNATTLNVAATLPTGVTIVGAATPSCTTAGAGAEYTYNLSGNIWYRLR